MIREIMQIIVGVTLCAAVYAGDAKPLAPEKEFTIPRFKGEFESIFDDVMYDAAAKKLICANISGMGEFPIKDGEIVFGPPGFVAACPDCKMRGFIKTKDVPMTALLWARLAISVSNTEGKTMDYTVPGKISNPTGISHDGKAYLVSDKATNMVYKLQLDKVTGGCVVVDKVQCEGKGVQAVTYSDGRLWTTDGEMLFEHGKGGKIEAKWQLNVKLSGIAFGEGKLWATGLDERRMYRFPHPDPSPDAALPAKDNQVVLAMAGSDEYHPAGSETSRLDAKQIQATNVEALPDAGK